MSVASAQDGAQLRLFFALWPDDARRGLLAAAAAALLADNPAALPVAAANYHLTLAFVGAVPQAALDPLRRIGAAQRASAITLEFDAYEYWPKPEVVVAAARHVPAALAESWESLHRALAAEGWALRPKRLRPHVTLVRQVRAEPRLPALARFDWSPTQLCLAQSESRGADVVYTVLDTWPLLYD